jgi:hypothetical protein
MAGSQDGSGCPPRALQGGRQAGYDCWQMRITRHLPAPTPDYVKSKIKEFNRDNEVTERALGLLIEQFPENTDTAHVLLKVAAINSLYNTQIYGLHVVAEKIVECRIDEHLDAGKVEIVNDIATVTFKDRSRCNYSFATKFCNWHRPELFPIYDSRVDFCLRCYRRKDDFYRFVQEDLWKYAMLREVIVEFRSRYALTNFSFKEIDMFLYQVGNDLLKSDSPMFDTDESLLP